MQIVRKKPKKKGILTSKLVTSSGILFLSLTKPLKIGESKKTPAAPEGDVGVFELKTMSYSMHEILPPSFTPLQ
jgi:hypothetical protein